MARTPVLAAGGIVLRQAKPPLIGVVRLRKGEWVLPKGKLDDGETPRDAAMREVIEETGHDVSVHEFLGTLAYDLNGRSKIVHYWRMETNGKATRDLMPDVTAVDWLPLDAAVERLSRDHERAFLANVGPLALESARRSRDRKPAVIEKPAAEKPRRRRVAAPKETPVSPTPVSPAPVPSAPLASAPVPPAPVAPRGDETVPVIAFAPRAVEHDAVDESSAAAIAPVLEEARAPTADAIALDAARLRDDRTAVEQSVSHVTMMRRMRNWLRRAS